MFRDQRMTDRVESYAVLYSGMRSSAEVGLINARLW